MLYIFFYNLLKFFEAEGEVLKIFEAGGKAFILHDSKLNVFNNV